MSVYASPLFFRTFAWQCETSTNSTARSCETHALSRARQPVHRSLERVTLAALLWQSTRNKQSTQRQEGGRIAQGNRQKQSSPQQLTATKTGMEAFAICGIDHTTTTDDNEDHAQVIVDVAVIAADASSTPRGSAALERRTSVWAEGAAGSAVRKAPRTDAPAYVVDARISATRPGSDRGWTACAQLHGANPSLSSGGLTGSLRAPLLLWRRVAAPSDRAAPLVALRLTTGTPQKPWAPLSVPSSTQFPRTTALIDAVASRRPGSPSMASAHHR